MCEQRHEDDCSLGRGQLRRLLAYGREVFGLDGLFDAVRDTRCQPEVSAGVIASIIFFCGLLRIRSLNALEPKLDEPGFTAMLGDVGPLCSVDTVARSLCRMDLATVQRLPEKLIALAERNKVFREGWHGALRFVALDGWEIFSSYDRHCDGCLERQVSRKQPDGSVTKQTQYYHRVVVAMLIDPRFDLVLGVEPLRPSDQRPVDEKTGRKPDAHEGEQTAAIRLLERVKRTFPWLDVAVADGLYANGPFLTTVQRLGMGAVVVAKKETDEPLKEALALWGDSPPQTVVQCRREHPDGRELHKKERISLWDCQDLETLGTYNGPIRVVRAEIETVGAPNEPRRTWTILAIGKWVNARLTPLQILQVVRGRWHIENTGFHQWTTRWQFPHVFVHNDNALLALFHLFFAAYNLLTLFLYRQVKSYGRDRGKDPTRTISRFVDILQDDLARLTMPPDG